MWWLWWWWSRRYDMSLTICHNSPAPNFGSRVPVDTAPGPVPVYRALKKSSPHPSCQDRQLELVAAATQRRPPTSMNSKRHRQPSTCHCTQRVCQRPGPKNSTRCNCGSSAVSSTCALEKLDLHKKTSTNLSMYCSGRNAMVTGPRESASAPRQECRRPGPSTNTTQAYVVEHNGHVNDLVNVLQQENNYGLLNSKTMGIRLHVENCPSGGYRSRCRAFWACQQRRETQRETSHRRTSHNCPSLVIPTMMPRSRQYHRQQNQP